MSLPGRFRCRRGGIDSPERPDLLSCLGIACGQGQDGPKCSVGPLCPVRRLCLVNIWTLTWDFSWHHEGMKEDASRKDFSFWTKLPSGSGFLERTWRPPISLPQQTSSGFMRPQGENRRKNDQRLAQHVCGTVLCRLRTYYGYTDRCRRQKWSLQRKHTPPPVISPALSLIVGPKGLDWGRSHGLGR